MLIFFGVQNHEKMSHQITRNLPSSVSGADSMGHGGTHALPLLQMAGHGGHREKKNSKRETYHHETATLETDFDWTFSRPKIALTWVCSNINYP